MRKYLILLICILPWLVLGCSCGERGDSSTKKTIICGKIQHLDVYPTTNEIFAEVIDFRDRKTVFKDSIKKDGTFKIVFDLYAAQDIKMRPLLDNIVLHPGDSLFIHIDFSDISNVRFSGDRALSNKALRQYQWSSAGICNFYNNDNVTTDKYKAYCDSILSEAINLNQSFIANKKPPREIIKWINDDLKIKYFNSLLSYPINYFRRDTDAFTAWFNKTSYYDFTQSIENNFTDVGTSLINSDIYKLLHSYEFYFIHEIMNKSGMQDAFTLTEVCDAIINYQNGSIFRQMVLGNFHYQLLCDNLPFLFESQKSELDETIRVPFIKNPLFDFYTTVKKNIEDPKYASNAILSKMGINGRNMLDSIIADNKGKVLFVDLWATWCGPCWEGLKITKEIMPRYENKEVEFIFLCVNSTEKNWKATLSRLKINGKHYFCNNDQSKDIRRALGVEAIPHYVLINKQGLIVDPDCPGPANQAALDLIDIQLIR